MTASASEAGHGPEAAAAARPRRRKSLAARLVAVAALWSVAALALAGFILVELYRDTVERAFDSQLEVYQKAIIGAMAPTDGSTINRPENLGEPRFNLPLSGWYWTIADWPNWRIVHASGSLVGDMLLVPPLAYGQRTGGGFATGPGGEELRVSQRIISFDGKTYLIAVGGKTEGLRKDLAAFTGQVALTLAVFGLGLVAAVLLQVRFGLLPIRRMQQSLAAVRNGEAERIDEDLPRELAPLAVELNALIRSNAEVVDRARTHVGNLAHALKTPLSVLSNEAALSDDAFARKVSEQAGLMRTQVDHHLERARQAAQRRVIGVATPVEPVLARLLRAMTRIHDARGLAFDSQLEPGIRFRGEQQDLEDLAGNLIDNACKWADMRVEVTARLLPGATPERTLFEIIVEDDGPGLTEAERREAVKRGRRLDESVPGTGLGLSIVADLVALYGGSFELGEAEIGGLKARLVLPATPAGG
ncbi:ATP-binding protein [Pannonibacter tanglangensis]|uniref:ATP-binding protein n=1 Tax=Pannonibacter tanglangensis TaxID=2750084 RepID=UPI003296E363